MKIFKAILGLKDIHVTGNMKVATLKQQFKESFGTEIRVYKSTNTGKGARPADNDATLASISEKKVEDITISKHKTVGEVEEEFKEKVGIGIQVMIPDGSRFAPNDVKLKEVSKL